MKKGEKIIVTITNESGQSYQKESTITKVDNTTFEILISGESESIPVSSSNCTIEVIPPTRNKYRITLIIAITALSVQSLFFTSGIIYGNERAIGVSGIQIIGWSLWLMYILKKRRNERKEAV